MGLGHPGNSPKPISIAGVGNFQIQTNHGIYQIKLQLFNGYEATFSGICMHQITVEFLKNPLNGKVEGDLIRCFKDQEYDPERLPKLPEFVWGHTSFMLGIKYMRYNTEKIFQISSGLTI